jgi:hypothetical protein
MSSECDEAMNDESFEKFRRRFFSFAEVHNIASAAVKPSYLCR